MDRAPPPHLDPAISSFSSTTTQPFSNPPLTSHQHPPPPPQSQSQPHRTLVPFSDFLTQPSPHVPSPYDSLEPAAQSQQQYETEHDDDEVGEENVFRDMSFDDILEDLNARFLVNLPEEEMNLVRLYWQAEQAHWFYEDYIRPLNPLLPSLSQRQFTHLIIASSPLYSSSSFLGSGEIDYDAVWEEYCAYKKMVPCCGAIILSAEGDKCLMVRGWKSNAGWCFPRGKINSEESEIDCAIREVEEETGFDLTGRIIPNDCVKTQINAQEVTMFIVSGIDEGTTFETQTRKEIGAIEWVKFSDLPTWTNKRGPKRTGGKGQKKFYNVTPFVGPIKRYLKEHNIRPRRQPAGGRELQPFQFDVPASPVSSHSHAATYGAPRASTALDQLFQKFVHKQEDEKPLGTDADGLSRLFGQLNVVKAEADAAGLISQASGSGHQDLSTHDVDREDDALTRLLGGVVTPQTDAKSQMLALLKNPPRNASPSPQPQLKAHQSSLLSMLSAPKTPAGLSHDPSAPSSAGLGKGFLQSQAQKPMSLPTSPRPPSEDEDRDRRNRQRALLEMTIAGMGVDVPTHPHHPPLPSTNTSVPPPTTSYTSRPNMPATMPAPAHAYRPAQSSSSSTSPHLPPPPYSVVSQGMSVQSSNQSQQPSAQPLHGMLQTHQSPTSGPEPKVVTGSGQGLQGQPQPRDGLQQPPLAAAPQPAGEHQRALLGALFGPRSEPAAQPLSQAMHQPIQQPPQQHTYQPAPPHMPHPSTAGYPPNTSPHGPSQPPMQPFQPPAPIQQPYAPATGLAHGQLPPQQQFSHRPTYHPAPLPPQNLPHSQMHQSFPPPPQPQPQGGQQPPMQHQWRPPNPALPPGQGYGFVPPPSQSYQSYQSTIPGPGMAYPNNLNPNPNLNINAPYPPQGFQAAAGAGVGGVGGVHQPPPMHQHSGGYGYQPPAPQQAQGMYPLGTQQTGPGQGQQIPQVQQSLQGQQQPNQGQRSPTKGVPAAVHQPVPRPPVGGGLLGLMSGR